jgi:hypothetical protein
MLLRWKNKNVERSMVLAWYLGYLVSWFDSIRWRGRVTGTPLCEVGTAKHGVEPAQSSHVWHILAVVCLNLAAVNEMMDDQVPCHGYGANLVPQP